MKKRLVSTLFFLILMVSVLFTHANGANLLRDFDFSLPLFSSDCAWNQKADTASVLTENDAQILTLYRVLRGDVSDQYPAMTVPATTWPYMDINYNDYSVAIFKSGTSTQDVTVRDYEGITSLNTQKVPTGSDGTITVPSCASAVRPPNPQDTGSDGHLVLYDSSNYQSYDFWQATTKRDNLGNSSGGGQEGTAILEAGAIDVSDIRGPAINPRFNSSARASGVPLLAGLILPEDFENNRIAHALAVAIPGPRNAAGADPYTPDTSDFFYPTATTETDFYSLSSTAPACGQRLRLKDNLTDESGNILDETDFSNATKIFLTALRTYGAIIVDNAGGFSFYAEDIHTGNISLTDDQVNSLVGNPSGTPIPDGKTKWQIILETINRDLEMIPFAYGPFKDGQDASTALITEANFEFVEPASDPGSQRVTKLNAVDTWMYQIQDLDQTGAVDALKNTAYDLFVIEPGHNFNDFSYDTVSIINSLRTSPSGKKRLILAYIDIGQAEDYRDYWETTWTAPTATTAGSPDFLVTIDPDGWSGNYPVAYWDDNWQSLWTGAGGIVSTLAMFGFDGIYLDWVEAYDDTHVIEKAQTDNVTPATEMMTFIEALKAAGEAVTKNFLVVPQNAPYLIDYDSSRYLATIDALAVEDTWFHGAGDAEWDDPDAGDLHERHDDEWSTANRLTQYKNYLDKNLPVFSVDYCISRTNADQVYQDAVANGLVPLVTRVSLSKLTETPPPSLDESTVDIVGIEVTGSFTVGEELTFDITPLDTSESVYYRFSTHPGYGTSSYDGTSWTQMTSNEYQTDSSCTYAFNTAGKHIVVVWAKEKTSNSSIGVPIIGLSANISDAGTLTSPIDITGINISGDFKAGSPLTFRVDAQNSDTDDIYYWFSTHAGYGTSSYDGTQWTQMTSNEYQTDNECIYTFDTAEKHIVVVWAKTDPLDTNTGVPIIGLSVSIDSN